MAYVYQPYPKHLHKPDGSYKVVQNEAEKDAALAEGWNLKPGAFVQPLPEPKTEFASEFPSGESAEGKPKRGRPRKAGVRKPRKAKQPKPKVEEPPKE